MKLRLSRYLIATALLTSALHAQTQIGGGACSNSVLSGTYFYLITGSVASGNQVLPYAELGKLATDGNGGASGQSKASVNGLLSTYTLAGSYSVQPDCSGTITLTVNSQSTSVLSFRVTNSGQSIIVATSTPGVVAVGRAYRLSAASATPPPCNSAAFSGSYGYLLTGSIVSGNAAYLYADDGQVVADGNGGLAVSSNANVGGIITPATGTGTYSLAGDCSGTARVSNANGTVDYVLAVVQDGKGVLFIGTDPGYVIAGSAEPQFVAPQQAIVNSGSFAPGRLSAGSLFSVFGSQLAWEEASAQALPLPRTLGSTRVLVNGSPAPLFYVGPGQINAQMPFETPTGTPVSIVVSNSGQPSNTASVVLEPASPGVFTYGDNRAVVQNPDGSVNSDASPAHSGDVLVGYLTGGGSVNAAGSLQTGAASPSGLSQVTSSYSVTVGGVKVDVLYLGLTPSLVGLYQVNFRVPSLAPGDYPLVITVNGMASNGPNVSIAQ